MDAGRPGWTRHLGISLIGAMVLAWSDSSPAQSQTPALWSAHTGGVHRIDPRIAELTGEYPVQRGALAVAVDRERDRVWILEPRELLAYSLVGELLQAVELPGAQGLPGGLYIDTGRGILWAAHGRQIHAIDSQFGTAGTYRLPQAHTAAALDALRGHFWIAVRDRLVVLDEAGGVVMERQLPGAKSIKALAWSQLHDGLWVIADDHLLRLDASGNPRFPPVRVDPIQGLHQIDADGRGGVWLAGRDTLARADRTGTIVLALQPFADSPPGLINAIAADPATGSVWIAGQHRIRHLSADGVTVVEPELRAGGPARVIADLHVEAGAPTIRWLRPLPDSIQTTQRPDLEVSFSGTGIDPDSLRFQRGDLSLEASCNLHDTGALCQPLAPLQDGDHEISASIANQGGQHSAPDSVQFRIDTVAPVIALDHPPQGLLTNQSTITVRGHLDEAGALSLNGRSVPLGAAQRFETTHGLNEGSNRLLLRATDLAGHVTELDLTVILDTIPPPPAAEIGITLLDGGVVRVSTPAGGVEPGATIIVRNLRTGTEVLVTAAADGSFSAQVSADLGDQIRILVRDAAGNISEQSVIEVTAPPGSEPIRLTVTTPFNGQAIASDSVLVSGTVSGPANTGVSVNDMPATLVPEAGTLHFHVVVPLEPGGNGISVRASAPDGRSQTEEVSVLRTGDPAYDVQVAPSLGFDPLTVTITIGDIQSRGILQIAVDYGADGTIDFVSTDPTAAIRHQFVGAGLKATRLTIFDRNGNGHSQTVYAVATSRDHLDQTLRALWSGWLDRVQAGDHEQALRMVSEDSRSLYGPILEALAPHIDQVIAEFSQIEPTQLHPDFASYALMTLSQGSPRVHFVNFIRSSDGVWRIDSL